MSLIGVTRGKHQEYAPVAQPDGAAVGLEAQKAPQIAVLWVFKVDGLAITLFRLKPFSRYFDPEI